MNREELNQKAKQIIEQNMYINVATITPENEPWNTPMYFGYDDDYNLYTYSWKENQHVKNIQVNKNVYITIYDSSIPAGEGSQAGVYMKAKAHILIDKQEIKHALKIMDSRIDTPVRSVEEFEQYPLFVTKFVPSHIWINDYDSERQRDFRVEVKLL